MFKGVFLYYVLLLVHLPDAVLKEVLKKTTLLDNRNARFPKAML